MRTPLLLLSLLMTSAASLAQEDRVQLRLDTSEADAVLAILDGRASGDTVSDAHWKRLFASEPYVRLKKREASMHRDFTDDDFKAFVVSDGLAKRVSELHRTLREWRETDVGSPGTELEFAL